MGETVAIERVNQTELRSKALDSILSKLDVMTAEQKTDALPHLEKMLNAPDFRLRAKAAFTSGEVGAEISGGKKEKLLNALHHAVEKDENSFVKKMASEAIEKMTAGKKPV